MSHPGGRDQREQGVDHPQSGAQDRHEADLARQTVTDRFGHGRADGVFGDREIARGFVADEQRDLVDELAEILGARLLGAEHVDLVQDQRMVHHMKFGVRHFLSGMMRSMSTPVAADSRMAERGGFEPPEGCPSSVFKTDALNRSTISPRMRPASVHGRRTRKVK